MLAERGLDVALELIGETGEVLLTPLDQWAMPLLRYQVGDVGSASDGDCPCGRGLPLMQAIQGRVQDLIVTRDLALATRDTASQPQLQDVPVQAEPVPAVVEEAPAPRPRVRPAPPAPARAERDRIGEPHGRSRSVPAA